MKLLTLSIILLSALMSNMTQARTKLYLTSGNRTLTATLSENETTHRLTEMLANNPITVSMEDFGGFEKVGDLPVSLPASNSQITTVPGDIMLYQGRSIVIFYGSNSWSYTPLGKIDNATSSMLREFLGSGTVEVTLSLQPMSSTEIAKEDCKVDDVFYRIDGTVAVDQPLKPGLYIVNGRKIIVR
ncbi:MAG: hypothetical protein K2M07_07475 [Muribaculaceae bacterium]|nr:hypothetical protein [Muribaculaceae bacterium]